jgi:DNA ligase 1
MLLSDLLTEVKQLKGTNAKRALILENDSYLLRKTLKYSFDPFVPFHVVKIPKTRLRDVLDSESIRWTVFFDAADACARRKVTGNAAIAEISRAFSIVTEDEEKWMRKILKKHIAIGLSTTTINKDYPSLIPTFDVSLAQKFDLKRVAKWDSMIVERKLDGIRCFGIVRDGGVTMYARSGKAITNFIDTIGPSLIAMGDGCYDGELMGDDFVALMRQAYRKGNVKTDGTFLALFDFCSLEEWDSKDATTSYVDRLSTLNNRVNSLDEDSKKLVTYVDKETLSVSEDADLIKVLHDKFVAEGFEGAMIKNPQAPYQFKRSYDIMKLKAFFDVDLPVDDLLEGRGKHVGTLGAFVVYNQGVKVQVGSGLSDEIRSEIWANKEKYIGRTIEIRYQEITPDGSLRFPTFVCFRNDRD